ncbi:MAG: FecR domain-containing protein [Cytophagales bacterium]|nr:FecR domain-containing protein [Cytophagales bacterium]
MNAGTCLKYPAKFTRSGSREVFLTGEAYFDVAKDPSHPFVVNAGALNVQVTGTQFNVAAYPEDATTNVVLMEGSVELFTNRIDTEAQHRLVLLIGTYFYFPGT